MFKSAEIESWSHVDFPVPRGPSKRNESWGVVRNLLNFIMLYFLQRYYKFRFYFYNSIVDLAVNLALGHRNERSRTRVPQRRLRKKPVKIQFTYFVLRPSKVQGLEKPAYRYLNFSAEEGITSPVLTNLFRLDSQTGQ
jgi:hypothetical protein